MDKPNEKGFSFFKYFLTLFSFTTLCGIGVRSIEKYFFNVSFYSFEQFVFPLCFFFGIPFILSYIHLKFIRAYSLSKKINFLLLCCTSLFFFHFLIFISISPLNILSYFKYLFYLFSLPFLFVYYCFMSIIKSDPDSLFLLFFFALLFLIFFLQVPFWTWVQNLTYDVKPLIPPTNIDENAIPTATSLNQE